MPRILLEQKALGALPARGVPEVSHCDDANSSFITDSDVLADGSWTIGSDNLVIELRRFSGRSSLEIAPRPDHLLILQCAGTGPLFRRRNGRALTSIAIPGTVLLLPAGSTAYLAWEMPHAHMTVSISANMVATTAAELCGRKDSDAQLLTDVLDTRDKLVEHLGLALLSEIARPDHPARTVVVDSTARALVAHLLRTFDLRDRSQSVLAKDGPELSPRHLSRVIRYIEQNISRPISLDDLATIAQVSRFHFTRLFKRTVGISPMAYLERSRVQRAQDLIKEGELPLAEIAVAVGFADQSHFTRRFHLHNGLTPAVFARRYGFPSVSRLRRELSRATIVEA
jgi:AraC family transcriptional regulator